MALPNIFTKIVAEQIIQRINLLKPTTHANWGKMNVSQMFAHCNVTYEIAFENKHPKPNFFMGLILKTFVKKIVVSEMPYPKSGQTAPAFVINDNRDFEVEKSRLIAYINHTVELDENSFENKLSLSFGKLSKTEWNNLFYKHLDHHLSQFGV